MESQLLRCKVLELLFHHSCAIPASLPLSLSKILHFLSCHSLLLQYQVSPSSSCPALVFLRDPSW